MLARQRTLKFLFRCSSSSRMAATLPHLRQTTGCVMRGPHCPALLITNTAPRLAMCLRRRSPVAVVGRRPNSHQLIRKHGLVPAQPRTCCLS